MLNLALVSARERFIIFSQVLRTIRNEALFFLFLELIYTGLQGEQILLHLLHHLLESINHPGPRLHIFRRRHFFDRVDECLLVSSLSYVTGSAKPPDREAEAVDVARVLAVQPCVHALNKVCCIACEVPRSASVAEG